MIVLDASALLALLNDETGSDVVELALSNSYTADKAWTTWAADFGVDVQVIR